MKTKAALSLVLLIFNAAVGSSAQPGKPAIHINSDSALMDEVIHIQLSGLPPKKAVTLRAQTDVRGELYQAHASFVADEQGKAEVSKQAPTAGTYTGADPMGLFWSMELNKTPPAKELPTASKITDPRVTRFEVETDGQTIASKEIKRWFAKPGVRVSEVKENGLVGRLFEPEEKGRRPGLLVLGGSEGGLGFSEQEAALLASHGYVALALAYFDAEGLPKELVEIPLEYLKKGIDWLATRESVDNKRLGLVGTSKGGELALLLASRFPELKAVVARAPSHVVWFGLRRPYDRSGWTYDGKPLPFVPPPRDPQLLGKVFSKPPWRFVDLYRPALDNEDSVKKALIEVERINGPVLLISGTDDLMFPSALMADKVIARLKEHTHPHASQHLSYEGAGHAVPIAYFPMRLSIPSGLHAHGGTPQANAKAMADSRPKTLRFLKESLGER